MAADGRDEREMAAAERQRLAHRAVIIERELAATHRRLEALSLGAPPDLPPRRGRPAHAQSPGLLTRRQIALLTGYRERTVANLLARGVLADRHPFTVGEFMRSGRAAAAASRRALWRPIYDAWRRLANAPARCPAAPLERVRKSYLTHPREGAEMALDGETDERAGLTYVFDEEVAPDAVTEF